MNSFRAVLLATSNREPLTRNAAPGTEGLAAPAPWHQVVLPGTCRRISLPNGGPALAAAVLTLNFVIPIDLQAACFSGNQVCDPQAHTFSAKSNCLRWALHLMIQASRKGCQDFCLFRAIGKTACQ